MPTVETYYNITEKQERLAELYRKLGSKAVFIVPSGLDRDSLLALISGKGSFFGARPVIWTWSDLYKEVSGIAHDRPKRVIDPPDHDLIISYLLNRYLGEEKDRRTDMPEGVFHSGFSEVLGNNIKELLREDITPVDLRERLFNEEGPPETSPGYILLRLYSDYLEYLDQNRIADSAQTPALIRECLCSEASAGALSGLTFILVGFLTFTGGQLKLVKKLQEIAETEYLLPETGLDSLHDSILQVGLEFKDRAHWKSDLLELKAPDHQLQFDAIARETALWAHDKGGFCRLGKMADYGDIGIMVTAQHLSLIENSLQRYKIPFNVQVRGTVADTLMGELPKMIWNAFISGWESEKTAFLLSSPLLRSPGFELSSALSAFPEGSRSWKALLKGKPLDLFISLEKLCTDFCEGGTPPRILKLWLDFINSLDLLNVLGTLVEDTPSLDEILKDVSSSVKELEKKIEILEDISKDIGPASRVQMKREDAVSYIYDWGRSATLPIRLPQSRSVTVYAGIPPVLTTHRYWIMTDVDYNTWPGKLRESPLFDNESKNRFNNNIPADDGGEGGHSHIPELHEEREQKEALFRRLIATSLEGTVLSRSLTDNSGRPLGASQFMVPLIPAHEKAKTQQPDRSIEYKPSDAMPSDGTLWFCGAEIPLSAEKKDRGVFPRSGEGASSGILTVSLSNIDEWKECPYRYWCRNNIKLKDHNRKLFDPLRAGLLMHAVWERSWREYLSSPRSFSLLSRNEWKKASSDYYPELLGDPRLERHADRLIKQIGSVAELLDRTESSDVIKKRRRTELEYKLPEYSVDGVIFRGRADRVDFYDDGFVVIDYKSNRSNDHANELQLAAYSLIISKTSGAKPLGYGWIGHGDASFYGYFTFDAMSDAYRSTKPRKKIEDLIDLAESTMKGMADSINKDIFPAKYDSLMCRSCELYVICRKREGYREDPENGDVGGYGDDS
ncbi:MULTISPECIES: PD-(D/E)XK nuclease family protein [Synergistaceae]|uniref:PD-(D/E)XK nuclease family protein n=1 Tax=Synergistaceae TaxID=649777 RepID=UPI003ADE3661|nr:PD-(D/E)XK nuclease family protein [Synergistaceae bacterium DZ-S4]